MAAPTRVDIVAPAEQEGTRAVVRTWLKAVGDAVEVDEAIVELETDKVAMEVSAPVAGTLAEITAEAGVDAPAGLLLGRIALPEPPPSSATEARPPLEEERFAEAVTRDSGSVPATSPLASPELRLAPGVRRRIAELGLDPAAITGTGRDGRVTRADVDAAITTAVPRPTEEGAGPTAPQAVAHGVGRVGGTEAGPPRSRLVPHTPMRRRIAERMSASVAAAPHVTAVFEADFAAILAHRQANRDRIARDGVQLTLTAYVVAAAVQAMAAAPSVNARWRDDAMEVCDDVNVGVGTALGDEGLVVPVVHRAQDLSLQGIAARLTDMTARARTNRLAPADVAHGTFSISNHGVSGSLVATPVILVPPQVAILGVGKLEKRVVVREIGETDAIQVRPMAYVSLTIDHRAIDGHQTNAWLTRFVETLQGWPQD